MSTLSHIKGELTGLQWGRGCDTAEIHARAHQHEPHASSFNGAAVVTPRRSMTGSSNTETMKGFNGAAVVTPRRYARLGLHEMLRINGFNGAAVVTPRRFAEVLTAAMDVYPASMGPR